MFWEEQRLEAEAAIAVVADSVVHTICANLYGAAFWALLCGCRLEPLLASVCDCGEGVLIVVEECFDCEVVNFHFCRFYFGLVRWLRAFDGDDNTNLLGLCNRKIKIFFVIEKILLNFY